MEKYDDEFKGSEIGENLFVMDSLELWWYYSLTLP